MQPNFALVLLTKGIFGGAEKRFAQLFNYLAKDNLSKYYFIVSYELYNNIKEIFPDYPTDNLIPIGSNAKEEKRQLGVTLATKIYIADHPGFIKQIYRFIKSFRIQKKYFRVIEAIRKEKNIKCFLGIYSGILPLYFYLKKRKRDVGIIFCNMDSWFRDVLPSDKKYWYRKYSSFNFALEKSDVIDFLSPYILKGVKEKGIKINEESVSITPCSFTDYSTCRIGNKNIFQVVFAGRLEKGKNPELFLEAAIILAKKYPEILFHILGEGRLSSDIKLKLINVNLSNIIFHGFYQQPTEILADSSVFVSIQSTNNYPSQSVLEAMGCGNAIIASDVGDTRMFINENNGILINLEISELVNAIETLYLDKELREKLGENAYHYIRVNHTIEKVANYYNSLFDRTLEKINQF
jgi:glycosyltransferase involved in cell wall biosynthesis